MTAFNVYCDESCHLELDHHRSMVLGALTCRARRTREIAARIREIKSKHMVSPWSELKWTKVSPKSLPLYLAVVDYFFQEPDLTFRAVVVPDKSILNHAKHGHTHDDFYFKMYFYALRPIIARGGEYRAFLDIKDTRSGERTASLKRVLQNNFRDWEQRRLSDVQIVRSHDVQQMQLADVLIGAVSYANRGLATSAAKATLIQRIRERSGLLLTSSSPYVAHKLNVFVWESAGGAAGE